MNTHELRMKKELAAYEDNAENVCTFYDHLSYKMDYDLCSPNEHRLISGNVIKSPHYSMSAPFTVTNQIIQKP